MTLPELIVPTSLTTIDGRLNPGAVGWARRPLWDTSGIGRGRGRNKRWEYWNITTGDFILALTISSLDYAAVNEVWLYEISTGQTWHHTETAIPAHGVELPESLNSGPAHARYNDLEIEIEPHPGGEHDPPGTWLRARIPGMSCEIFAEKPTDHDALAVVVPWSHRRFQYTVKDIARPATGVIIVDGFSHPLPVGESWAVLDHGRGRWPYDITWNWGAGSGRSGEQVIGIQVGGKWTEGTGSTENAFVVDGRMHHIPIELTWDYNLDKWRRPWRIHGGGLEAEFTPFHNKRSRTNYGVFVGQTDQCFGYWSGRFTTEDETVEFKEILGWAEEVHNRW